MPAPTGGGYSTRKVTMTRGETAGAETRTAKADAMEFLRAALVGAPVPAAELSRVAHERGSTPKAIRSMAKPSTSTARGSGPTR